MAGEQKVKALTAVKVAGNNDSRIAHAAGMPHGGLDETGTDAAVGLDRHH
jgi:hypothetical protein